MLRAVLPTVACLALGGCITNTQSTQNAQIVASAGGGAPARPAPPPPPPRPVLTPSARLTSAQLITANKTTSAGATLMLTSLQSLNRDCTALGELTAKVVTQPEHGTVQITRGSAFSNYAPADPPYLCNARRSPATIVTYQSAPGYEGEDTASIQVFFPDGKAPTMLFHIAVR